MICIGVSNTYTHKEILPQTYIHMLMYMQRQHTYTHTHTLMNTYSFMEMYIQKYIWLVDSEVEFLCSML